MAPKSEFHPILSRHRQLAPTASVRVSPLCLGTMIFGGRQEQRYGECSKETAFSILDHFYASGGNFLDTANAYQDGQSEVWLGEWMASRKNRDQLVLATKFTTPYKGIDKESRDVFINSNFGGNGSKSMKLSLRDSLEKLGTDYIDLLYLHWWDYSVSIPELMHSLNDLVVSGKVLYLGVSDAPAWVVTKANQYARDHGLRQFVVYQGMYNASLRDFERDILPMCADEGMGICPYGVLNQGRFQTEENFKARENMKPGEGRNFIPLSSKDKQVSKVLEDLAKSSQAGNVKITDVALAYVIQKQPYIFPIVGGRKLSHIVENIEGLKVSLTEEEIGKIENAYNFDHGFPHSFLSGTLMQGSDAKSKGAAHPGDVGLTTSIGQFDWIEGPKAIRPS